jgi:hypothetical protein
MAKYLWELGASRRPWTVCQRDGQTGARIDQFARPKRALIRDQSPLFSRATTEAGGCGRACSTHGRAQVPIAERSAVHVTTPPGRPVAGSTCGVLPVNCETCGLACGEVLANCEREASEHRFGVRPRCHVRIGTEAGIHLQKVVGRGRAKDGPLNLQGASPAQAGARGRSRGLKPRLGAAYGYGLAREG